MSRGLSLWHRQLGRECDRLERAMAEARGRMSEIVAADGMLAERGREERRAGQSPSLPACTPWFEQLAGRRRVLAGEQARTEQRMEALREALLGETLRQRAVAQVIAERRAERVRRRERREAAEADQQAAMRIYRRGAL